jgi:hypothetical protein
MRRLLLLISVLLLGVSWAAAQNPGGAGQTGSQTSSAQTSASQSDSSGAQTIEGCLSGANGKYTLTDQQGKSYDLSGDTSKLANHVGHEVKITGTVSSGSASSTGSQMGSSSGQSLEVTSMKHVSKTCKNNSGGDMSH